MTREDGFKWVKRAGVVLGLGFSAAMFLMNHYASAKDFGKLADSFNKHVTEEGSRMSTVEERSKNTEEDYHTLLDQMFEIARATGAHQVERPAHRR